jgi:saccharopine dehydrogenase-like NADP-dependent oxidoreductase
MGRVAVRTLTEYSIVERITVADYNAARAHEVVAALNHPNIEARQIDVTNEKQLTALIHGSNVVLNAVDYIFNEPVLRACIRERVHYADLGGLFHMTRKQLAMDDEAQAAGITAIAGIGGTPGITNVLARQAVDRLERVDSIKIQAGGNDATNSHAPLSVPYSMRTILDEFTTSPQVFQDGNWYAQQPLSGQEEIVFPAPVGRVNAVYSLHSECATFPLSFRDKGIHHVSFKIAFPGDFLAKLKFLVDLGFGNEEPIEVQGVKVAPREVLLHLLEAFPVEEAEPQDIDILRVVVTGIEHGHPVEIINQVVVLPYRRWGISANALDTGVPLAIAGILLAQGKITRRGVCAAESCVPPESFFHELARYDMYVETSTRALS